MSELVDGFGRRHDYLRVSVTDRCNLRCGYCMPPEGIDHLPREAVLSSEKLLRIVRIGVQLGIRKVRVTGGEPLVRSGWAGNPVYTGDWDPAAGRPPDETARIRAIGG